MAPSLLFVLKGLTQQASPTDGPILFSIDSSGSFGTLFNELAQDGITALGANQAGAVQVIGQTIRVSAGAANTGILLPPSAAGLECLVINHAGNDIMVYGSGTDQIDDGPSATGVSQMNNSLVIFTCATAGKWYSEGLSTGFDPTIGLQTLASADGLVAAVAANQAGGTPITKLLNRFSTVAIAAQSGTLMASVKGLEITVINGGANSLNVFPAVGDAINALGANAAFAMAAGAINIFICTTAGQWFTK